MHMFAEEEPSEAVKESNSTSSQNEQLSSPSPSVNLPRTHGLHEEAASLE